MRDRISKRIVQPIQGALCVLILASCTENTKVMSKSEPGPSDANAPTEFTETESGLKYRILRASTERKPKATDTVLCNYKGWLDDGQEFDSSYSRGAAIDFPLNGVISGWTEGVQLIGEGGMIELEIPYPLGYGERGMPPTIPGKATLHFIVELEKVM